MKPLGAAAMLLLFIASMGFTQQSTQPPKTAAEPLRADRLVDEWFNRVNALDDWYISMVGKEQTEEVVDRVVDLYAADAMHFVGPNEKQIGGATFSGKDGISKWADDVARNCRDVAWRLVSRTFDEKTTSLSVTQAPWGGLSVAAELTFSYTDRDTNRRFMVPGAIFIDFKQDGKIRRLRLYLVRDERQEIFPFSVLG
jgi:hypothetical protein